jgi:hypothetical protein
MKIKDLFGAIFTEDIEEEDYDDEYYDDEYDDEYYEDEYEDEYYDDQPAPVDYPTRPEYDQTYVQPQVTAKTPAPVQPAKQSSFTNIEIDSQAREQRLGKQPQKKQPYKYDRSKTQKPVRRPQVEEEYTQVISTIFGNMEESEKQPAKVHDAIVLPKPAESDSFTKIISPMYGNNVPKYARIVAIPEMDPEDAPDLTEDTPVQEVKATLTLKDMLAKQNEMEAEETELL